MTRILKWFSENAKALGGIAALTIILGFLFGGISYLVKILKPEIIIRTNLKTMKLPPNLEDWVKSYGRWNSNEWESENDEEAYNDL